MVYPNEYGKGAGELRLLGMEHLTNSLLLNYHSETKNRICFIWYNA